MKPARLILLLVALVAGGLAAFLVTRGPAPEQVVTTEVVQEAKAQILVARTPIGVGERLTPASVEWQDWPEGAVRAEYVTIAAMPDAPSELTGAVARFEFFPGEPIRQAKLVRSDQGYLSAVLQQGKRGVSVNVDAASSAGGFIVPNDHVDVVLTSQSSVGERSEVILANVRILAIGKRLGEVGESGGREDPNEPSTKPITFDNNAIATLELDPAQAEVLINATTRGQLSLTLRSVADFNDSASPERPANGQTVRLIRFGKEFSVVASAGGQASQSNTASNADLPNVVLPTFSPTPTESTAAAEPQLLPE